ncbi:hypothetical protein Bca101_079087 [Brassica carinata]
MSSPPLALAQSPPPLHCWSELPLDLMQLIFERLGFTDFERAKSVCSSWLSGSRQSKPNNKIPWMILLPEEKNYFLLFNPEDREEKLYKTQHLGDDLANSVCLATCRSWLLMATLPHERLYILNLLTLERINLPKSCGSYDTILWIDERSKDYLVIGEDLAYFKKRNPLTRLSRWLFTSESDRAPTAMPQSDLFICRFCAVGVLALLGSSRQIRGLLSFLTGSNQRIFKMDSSNGNIKWKEIFSLGDEAIILDLGITVLAKDQEGITSNSIYFTAHEMDWFDTDIFVFNLDTNKVEQLPQLVSSVSFTEARWFLPSFRNG